LSCKILKNKSILEKNISPSNFRKKPSEWVDNQRCPKLTRKYPCPEAFPPATAPPPSPTIKPPGSIKAQRALSFLVWGQMRRWNHVSGVSPRIATFLWGQSGMALT
jgi:hypothetical protein